MQGTPPSRSAQNALTGSGAKLFLLWEESVAARCHMQVADYMEQGGGGANALKLPTNPLWYIPMALVHTFNYSTWGFQLC